MTQQIRLDITPFFQPLAAVRNEPLRSIDGVAHLRDSGVEPSDQPLYWLGLVWVRDDGEGLTAISPDQQLAVLWASPCHPDSKVPVAILEHADAEKAELFLSHVMEARLGTSPTALDLLVRGLYSNDATGRQFRTVLFGTAAKAKSVAYICENILFNPQKVSLFNQRKKELGLTRARRESENELRRIALESKQAEVKSSAEEPSVSNPTEPTSSSEEELDMLADFWLGLHIELDGIPSPDLDIVELRRLMTRAQVSESSMLLSLDQKWRAHWAKSDKSDVGAIFSAWRRKLVTRLNEKLLGQASDPHPN